MRDLSDSFDYWSQFEEIGTTKSALLVKMITRPRGSEWLSCSAEVRILALVLAAWACQCARLISVCFPVQTAM